MIQRALFVLASVLSISSGSVACVENPGTTQPAHTATAAAAAAQTGQGPAAALRPLKHYLGGAVQAKVVEMGTDSSGRPGMTVTRTLAELEVKDRLAALDLDQLPDGPLMRCPTTAQVRFEDKEGHLLGSLGSCGGAWRFDAPDGTRGGVRVVGDPVRGPAPR